jgi:4-hydroxybenzoate polyprenyltransferase
MPASEAAQQEAYLPPRFAPAHPFPAVASESALATRSGALAALSWALLASTGHRVRRGEGALLAINLSLILHHGDSPMRGCAQALVSTLAILVMYAFNDLYDAPVDSNNPKKDHRLIAIWMEHRRVGVLVTFLLKIATLILALVALGPAATAAVAAVMIVNVVYSTMLKGVPVADVVAVAVWGALYASIVGAAPTLVVVVGLMTAICHVFQVLDDREPDAANGIVTTAVRSATLSRDVLIVLSIALVVMVLPPFGRAGALTAMTPVAIYFLIGNPGTGWLLTKAYFAVMWLALLGSAGATG